MLVHITILSFWEIAHYWHGIDPRESTTHNLPLNVRDTLLVLAMNFGDKLSVRAEYQKAYLLEIYRRAPRFTSRHYRQTFRKAIDRKEFGKRFFSNMFLTRSQLGRWCLKHKEPLPQFWFPDDDKYPFKKTGSLADEMTANGRYVVQLLYDDSPEEDQRSDQDGAAVTSVSENSAKAARAKHAAMNQVKERFIAFCNVAGSRYPSKKAAAESFFDGLSDPKEKLLFHGKEQATRTLLDALRTYQQQEEARK